MPKISLVVKITALPGRRDELVDVLTGLIEHAETEVGTEMYVPNLDEDDDDVIWFYEIYADADARDSHRSSPVMTKVAGPALQTLLAGPPETHVCRLAGGKGLPA
jgi:quinol monooxygenase YgiN